MFSDENGKEFDIELLPLGDDHDAELRGRQPTSFPTTAEQAHYGDSLIARSSVISAMHGTLSPGGDPASLLVIQFRFLSTRKSRRFTGIKITIQFEDSSGDTDSGPEVMQIAPEGEFGLHKTERIRTVKIHGNAGVDVAGANSGFSWSKEEEEQVENWTRLSGTAYQLGVTEWDNAVMWSMQENGDKKTGVPTFLRGAALLRRHTSDTPFDMTIKVQASVDFSTQARLDLRRLLGKKDLRIAPRPLTIDPQIKANPKEEDLCNMEALDIQACADVALITLLDS